MFYWHVKENVMWIYSSDPSVPDQVHTYSALSLWIHIGLSPILDDQKKKAFEKKFIWKGIESIHTQRIKQMDILSLLF